MKKLKIILAVLVFLTPTLSLAQTLPTDGLVAHWTFDEGSGTVTGDSVGTNIGTLTNGPTWVAGKIGGALQFDGVDDYIDIGSPGLLTSDLSVFTVSLWIKSSNNSSGNDTAVITFGKISIPSLKINLSSDRAIIYMGDNNFRYFNHSPVDIDDGNWHHLVFIVPGSAKDDINSSMLYADGQVQSIGTTKSTGAQSVKDIFLIGDDFYDYFGAIDDVRIYNRMLSENEILQLYNKTEPSLGNTSVLLSDSIQVEASPAITNTPLDPINIEVIPSETFENITVPLITDNNEFNTTQTPTPITTTNLSAAPNSSTQITLNWNVSSNATSYKVYRNNILITTRTTNSYTDTGLTPSTTYIYTVSAQNSAGESTKTSEKSVRTGDVVTVPVGDSFLPSFPGAEGFGAKSIGGRGGKVIKVTNLNEHGPGSFREAVEATPRHYAGKYP